MIRIAPDREVYIVALTVLAAVNGCGGEREAAQRDDLCDAPIVTAREDTGTVIVRGTDGPCALDFREIITLRGDPQGELPKAPIVRGANGQWISGTYDPGEVAFWSAAGDLIRTIGRGPGEGPGEFMDVRELVVDTFASEIYIFAGAPKIDVYSFDGAYLRQISLPAMPASGVRLADGTIAATVMPPSPDPFLVLARANGISRAGPQQRFDFPPLLRAAADGIWSAEGPWYEIAHHAPSDGHIDFRVKREAPWYTEPTMTPGHVEIPGGVVTGIAVDSRKQLIVVNLTAVPDPNAPDTPLPRLPAEGEAPAVPRTREERDKNRRMYLDAIVEAFTMDGRLVASERYDDGADAPLPLNALNSVSLWYHVNNDMSASIQVLELVIVKKGDRN